MKTSVERVNLQRIFFFAYVLDLKGNEFIIPWCFDSKIHEIFVVNWWGENRTDFSYFFFFQREVNPFCNQKLQATSFWVNWENCVTKIKTRSQFLYAVTILFEKLIEQRDRLSGRTIVSNLISKYTHFNVNDV